MKNSISALCLSFIVIASGTSLKGQSNNEDFAPGEIYIKSIQHSGSGCRQGTVSHDITADGEVMLLLFDEYIVEHEGSFDNHRSKKDCNIRVNLNVPQDWTFGVFYTGLEGYADLESGVRATQDLSYRFEPSGARANFRKMRIDGEFFDTFSRVEELEVNRVKFAPCVAGEKYLNIDTSVEIRSRGQGGFGYMSIDLLDSAVSQSYGLVYKPCNPNGSQKKFFASCHVDLYKDGNLKRQIVTQGKGKNRNKALQKAERRLEKKCQRVEQRRPGVRCDLAAASCQASRLF